MSAKQRCWDCRTSISDGACDYSDEGQPLCANCSQLRGAKAMQRAGRESRIESESKWTAVPFVLFIAGLLLGHYLFLPRWQSIALGLVFLVGGSFLLGGLVGNDTLSRSVGEARASDDDASATMAMLVVRWLAKLGKRLFWSRRG